MSGDCPFCVGTADYLFRVGTAAVIRDSYPVNRGHLLAIPVAHRRDLRACTEAELADLWRAVDRALEFLDEEHNPDGYNIGTNIGRSAGQTVFHCHVHVIPRFEGDCEMPRGGVRKVKPPLVEY